MAYQTITFSTQGDTGILNLSQPPSNKMSRQFFGELKDFLAGEFHQANCSSLIIKGNGRHFSAGADIEDLLSAFRKNEDEDGGYPSFFEDNRKLFQELYALKIPVIAAIQGICLGSALELAMFCHFRICARSVLMALPEVSFNLIPGCGGTQRLQELCGRNRALEIMLDGGNFSADQALEWGIIDYICDKNELMDVCIRLAKTLQTAYQKERKHHYIKTLL